MKKSILSVLVLFSFGLCFLSLAQAEPKHYKGEGEVLSVDPLYSRITIEHGAITDFAGDGETEFFVTDAKLLKEVSRRDLVEFTITEDKGEAFIDKITVVGVAEKKPEGLEVGKVVQDVLVGTGEVAKVVTSPIAPANEVVSGTVDATTGATDEMIGDATVPGGVKREF
ncbi:MAG TPA: copper-binding protein [Candidatus Omnitrophota bacterium]|nr:copper-binding protein [Candidatus Omnitrophota bacterium]